MLCEVSSHIPQSEKGWSFELSRKGLKKMLQMVLLQGYGMAAAGSNQSGTVTKIFPVHYKECWVI